MVTYVSSSHKIHRSFAAPILGSIVLALSFVLTGCTQPKAVDSQTLINGAVQQAVPFYRALEQRDYDRVGTFFSTRLQQQLANNDHPLVADRKTNMYDGIKARTPRINRKQQVVFEVHKERRQPKNTKVKTFKVLQPEFHVWQLENGLWVFDGIQERDG